MVHPRCECVQQEMKDEAFIPLAKESTDSRQYEAEDDEAWWDKEAHAEIAAHLMAAVNDVRQRHHKDRSTNHNRSGKPDPHEVFGQRG